ncbi:LysR substrate-binding domain-containing protein, partial [Mesorhizobium sp. M7A.F.Ca.CA.004.04.2.1]
MDRLEAMSLFVAAVEAGSLSAASRRFGIPLATVSRKISDLERHLNTRLLNRSTRRLTPTDAGQAYLAACRRILDEVGEAERTAAGEYSAPTGELAITAPVVFGRLHVLPVVTGFLAAYPDVDIRLTLADRITQLVEDHFDLAIRIGQLPDSSLVAIGVGAIRRVVCASPAYLAEHGTPTTP